MRGRFISGLQRRAAAHRFSKPVRILADQIFNTKFPDESKIRILVYYSPNPISWSLVYPFFYYAQTLADRFGAYVAVRPITDFLSGSNDKLDADVVIVQPWFTTPPRELEETFVQYKKRHPTAQLIFQDSYAHVDLRLGNSVNDYIEIYQKKSLFSERSHFQRSFKGDTNLTEFYSNLYNLPAEPVDWDVPTSIISKLALAPNFLTAPYLMNGFLGNYPEFNDRTIDLHSRIAVKGSPWYSAMRNASNQAARNIDNVVLTPDGRIPRNAYLAELRQSKLCWSPFGYGELCWRDLEAIMTGAVLLKPNMDHLDTTPNLYRAGETYLAVKWDFSDLEYVVQSALSDPDLLKQVAQNAFQIARDYLVNEVFADECASMFRKV